MASTRDISVWFQNEVWTPRLIYAIGFQSLLTFLITLLSISVLQLNVFRPFSSIAAALTVPFSWQCWLVGFISTMVFLPSLIVLAQIVSPKDQSFRTHFAQNGWRFVNYAMLWGTLQVFADLIITLCCLKLTGVGQRVDGVICYGVLIASAYSSIDYFTKRYFRLDFPVDLNYNKFKTRVAYFYEKAFRSQSRQSALFVGHVLAITVVTFIFFGWRFIRFTFKYPTTFTDALWHVLICRPSVVWSIAVLSAAIVYRRNSAKKIFDLFLCQPVQFILLSSDPMPLGQESDLFFTLGEALSADRPVLMKYLAFLDLRLLTLQRQSRMQQIFTVSRPGGHPRTWISVVSPMIQSLQYHTKIFRDLNDRLAAAWEYKIEQATSGRGMAAGAARIPSTIQPKHWNREWKLQSGPQQQASVNNVDNRQSSPLSIKGIANKHLPAFVTGFWIINPLIEDETLWADLILQLWNIEAFGHIISSSHSDDKYGIVQRDLAAIIGHLLDLYSVSDRYGRLVTSQRIDRHRKTELDQRLTSLRDRLKLTIDEICGVFGNLNELRLTDQQRTLMKRLTDTGILRK